MKKKDLIIFVLIVAAIASRFLFIWDGQSVLPNFTALGAVAIFGAAYLGGIKKWIYPLLVLWISDLVLNNVVYSSYYDHFMFFGSWWVYLSIAIIGLAAWPLMKKASWPRLAGVSILAAVLFFLITNFGAWISPGSPYPKNIAGLMDSYIAGIPFFRNTLMGNLFYGFAIFGAYEYFAKKYDLSSLLSNNHSTNPVANS